jgi:hypothetical protein
MRLTDANTRLSVRNFELEMNVRGNLFTITVYAHLTRLVTFGSSKDMC